ncbi:MAG TPA: helix-turn-helix domain-containing protein [Acidimicrobiales bacterium]
MIVSSVKNLAAAIKGERLKRGWTQAQLAEGAGTSRAWVVAVEKGKASAEVGAVLKTLAALQLRVDISPSTGPVHGEVDLDDILGEPR